MNKFQRDHLQTTIDILSAYLMDNTIEVFEEIPEIDYARCLLFEIDQAEEAKGKDTLSIELKLTPDTKKEEQDMSTEKELEPFYQDKDGRLIYQHRTNDNIFIQRACHWSDRCIMIIHKETLSVIDTYKFSTYDFGAWRLLTKGEDKSWNN